MKNSYLFLICLIVFISGFLTKSYFTTKPNADTKLDQCNDLGLAQKKLLTISETDYQDYLKIKDLKDKYEKADELLGKVMVLFLADLGFKLQKNTEPITESIKSIKRSESLEQAKAHLDQVLLKNAKVSFATGSTVIKEQIRIIEGNFSGEIKFFDSKKVVFF